MVRLLINGYLNGNLGVLQLIVKHVERLIVDMSISRASIINLKADPPQRLKSIAFTDVLNKISNNPWFFIHEIHDALPSCTARFSCGANNIVLVN